MVKFKVEGKDNEDEFRLCKGIPIASKGTTSYLFHFMMLRYMYFLSVHCSVLQYGRIMEIAEDSTVILYNCPQIIITYQVPESIRASDDPIYSCTWCEVSEVC